MFDPLELKKYMQHPALLMAIRTFSLLFKWRKQTYHHSLIHKIRLDFCNILGSASRVLLMPFCPTIHYGPEERSCRRSCGVLISWVAVATRKNSRQKPAERERMERERRMRTRRRRKKRSARDRCRISVMGSRGHRHLHGLAFNSWWMIKRNHR